MKQQILLFLLLATLSTNAQSVSNNKSSKKQSVKDITINKATNFPMIIWVSSIIITNYFEKYFCYTEAQILEYIKLNPFPLEKS